MHAHILDLLLEMIMSSRAEVIIYSKFLLALLLYILKTIVKMTLEWQFMQYLLKYYTITWYIALKTDCYKSKVDALMMWSESAFHIVAALGKNLICMHLLWLQYIYGKISYYDLLLLSGLVLNNQVHGSTSTKPLSVL